MRSTRELSMDNKLIELVESFRLSGQALGALKLLLMDEEIQAAQEYANIVSIVRLGHNDHGPVHMRSVTLNAIIMLKLLRHAGIQTSLEKDECGEFEDSLTGIIIASMLHDLGMGVEYQDHEMHSAYMAMPFLDRLLNHIYPKNVRKRVMIRALALEGIAGHMGNRAVHSLEAGIVQVADSCDMSKGRSRIPLSLNAGHIHLYSANSIEAVRISTGAETPIRIAVHMSNEVGLFQVEEVLLEKINSSTLKPYLEVYAQVRSEEPRRYL